MFVALCFFLRNSQHLCPSHRNPIAEEEQAIDQQDEFERLLFHEHHHLVLSSVPVTKGGAPAATQETTIPKQYYLVVTVNKQDKTDCKLHTIRVKDSGQRLTINKSSKVKKIQAIIKSSDDSVHSTWDFMIKWKNGSSEQWMISPNSLRSFELFIFVITVVCEKKDGDTLPFLLKGVNRAELNVHGRNWLSLVQFLFCTVL